LSIENAQNKNDRIPQIVTRQPSFARHNERSALGFPIQTGQNKNDSVPQIVIRHSSIVNQDIGLLLINANYQTIPRR
jgi:hypothetical protein